MLRSEVLPAPFGPMIETRLPRPTESETPSTARTPPKCFDTPEMASWVSRAAPVETFELPEATSARISSPAGYSLMPHPYGRHTADAYKRMQCLAYYPGRISRGDLQPRRSHETIRIRLVAIEW